VTFKYPESEKLVLDDVSFELLPGESVAIVGENGAGKSTLAKLMARLYDPTFGVVQLAGTDLRCYDKHDYYCQVSAVFQDYPHINLSARENIGFGDVSRLADEARILRAAEMGEAKAVLDELPYGLDTMLGKTIERGVEISGGQWQRLALARAFMRDAQVLILDEPSAALDPLAERDIYQRFAQLAAGKMTVLISHRLASCRMADRILVLEGGRIIEEGSHDTLMAHGGRYAEMFTAQAEQYVHSSTV
jgi:ATP-binding cassette subfamily B protein